MKAVVNNLAIMLIDIVSSRLKLDEAKKNELKQNVESNMGMSMTNPVLENMYKSLLHLYSYLDVHGQEINRSLEKLNIQLPENGTGINFQNAARQYKEETSDIFDILSKMDYQTKFLSQKEKMFKVQDNTLTFRENDKRISETI